MCISLRIMPLSIKFGLKKKESKGKLLALCHWSWLLPLVTSFAYHAVGKNSFSTLTSFLSILVPHPSTPPLKSFTGIFHPPHPLGNSWTLWFDNLSAESRQATWGSFCSPVTPFLQPRSFGDEYLFSFLHSGCFGAEIIGTRMVWYMTLHVVFNY